MVRIVLLTVGDNHSQDDYITEDPADCDDVLKISPLRSRMVVINDTR